MIQVRFVLDCIFSFLLLQGMAGDRGGPGQYPYNGQSSGNTPGPDSSYGGPDSLRNTANKMFSRGQAERSDSG